MITTPTATASTERIRRFYDQAAKHYDRRMRSFERVFLGQGRASVCGKARGDTLEIAVGTGLNLPHYSRHVRLTAIDLSSAMLDVAADRARRLGLAVALENVDAQRLPYADSSFDSVVCTLSLCTIPDERRALAEAYRVLRPGGRLLLLEHVRSPLRAVRWAQRLLDPIFQLSGDTLLRDPLDHLTAAGYRVEHCARSKWGVIEEVVSSKD